MTKIGGKSENMDINKGDKSEQNGDGDRGDTSAVTSAPLLFLQEREVFGIHKPDNAYLNHEEMYVAVGKVIEPTHITGLQRVNGLWRIYVENLSDKAKLMVSGVSLRGKSIPVSQVNPFMLDSEQLTRIRIQNVPLSADDNIIKHVLVMKGLEIRSFIREKLRINGKLTNCSTGDRLAMVKSSSLKEPLDRFMQIGVFKAKVIHRGQVNPTLKCRKCLLAGHVIADCTNEWKCLDCGLERHRKGQCNLQLGPDSEPESESETESVASKFANADNSGDEHDTQIPPKSQTEPESSTATSSIQSRKEPQSADMSKRRKKKAKSKSQGESEMSPAEHRAKIQKEISTYFQQNPTSGTPNNNKTSSVTRSPRSPLDDQQSTKKACNS